MSCPMSHYADSIGQDMGQGKLKIFWKNLKIFDTHSTLLNYLCIVFRKYYR